MDYEMKYKNALEWARQVMNGETGFIRREVEEIFPELKESEDERIKNRLIKLIKMSSEVGGFALHKWEADEMLTWLEKQGEQKPTDKVEPKFHKEEWLIENHPNNYARFVQILEIVNVQGKDRYRISRDLHNDEDIVECRFIEDNWHSFNIQDVKDGDVLTWDDCKCIALFKNIYDEDSFNSHGFVGHCTDTFESRLSYHDIKGVHPATKEQRDLLFQKMKEAGYEWDVEKKELRKIEKQVDGFDAELNALLKKYEHLPKEEILGCLNFYVLVLGKEMEEQQ